MAEYPQVIFSATTGTLQSGPMYAATNHTGVGNGPINMVAGHRYEVKLDSGGTGTYGWDCIIFKYADKLGASTELIAKSEDTPVITSRGWYACTFGAAAIKTDGQYVVNVFARQGFTTLPAYRTNTTQQPDDPNVKRVNVNISNLTFSVFSAGNYNMIITDLGPEPEPEPEPEDPEPEEPEKPEPPPSKKCGRPIIGISITIVQELAP